MTHEKINKFLHDDQEKFFIKWINYEFNSSCNLTCRWCTLDHSKKREIMEEAILVKSLDEIINEKKFEIERIDLHNAGETLLHPRLAEMLAIIAEKKNKFKNKVTVHLLTNAFLLDKKNTEIILNSNALDEIRFSVDGGSEEFYNHIRIGSNWKKVKQNLLNFIKSNNAHKNKLKTGVICMIPPEKALLFDWMEKDFMDLFKIMDEIELRKPHNWDGSKDLKLKNPYPEEANGRACKFLLKNLVILPNGDVTVCCADLNSRGVVGNLYKNSLKNILLSDGRLGMLDLFKNGKKNDIKLCKSCSGYYE